MSTLHLRDAFWPVVGATVLFYIVVAAASGIEPSEAEVLTAVVCLLAVVWTAHAWRSLWADEHRR